MAANLSLTVNSDISISLHVMKNNAGGNGSDVSAPPYSIVSDSADGAAGSGDGGGFFASFFYHWDVAKVVAALAYVLTQTLGNALLLGIVWCVRTNVK